MYVQGVKIVNRTWIYRIYKKIVGYLTKILPKKSNFLNLYITEHFLNIGSKRLTINE